MAAHLDQRVVALSRTVKVADAGGLRGGHVHSVAVDEPVRAGGADLRGGVESLGESTGAG
jgi:hypothetical protein